MEFGQSCAFGPEGKPCLWLKPGEPPTQPVHLAFMAKDRPAVDAFHAAALAAGAADNGAPGLREHYHPSYYGGFVIDPDGHNVEAVCHAQPGAAQMPAAAARASRATVRKAARKSVRKGVRKSVRKGAGRPASKRGKRR